MVLYCIYHTGAFFIMKNGFRTTEFWLNVLSLLVFAGFITLDQYNEFSTTLKILFPVIILLITNVYTLSRTALKIVNILGYNTNKYNAVLDEIADAIGIAGVEDDK